jgi:hypothetical protein
LSETSSKRKEPAVTRTLTITLAGPAAHLPAELPETLALELGGRAAVALAEENAGQPYRTRKGLYSVARLAGLVRAEVIAVRFLRESRWGRKDPDQHHLSISLGQWFEDAWLFGDFNGVTRVEATSA